MNEPASAAPASERPVIEPAAVSASLRHAFGPKRFSVRAVSRHCVRASLTRSAWLGVAPRELLRDAETHLRAHGYRVTLSERGVYQASSGFIPTLVVGYQLWEDDES